MIYNTKEFESYILNQNITSQKEEELTKTIKAFSEFISAVNPDFAYNKTYLGSFVEEFVLCQKALQKKRKIISRKIIKKIEEQGADNGVRRQIVGGDNCIFISAVLPL